MPPLVSADGADAVGVDVDVFGVRGSELESAEEAGPGVAFPKWHRGSDGERTISNS